DGDLASLLDRFLLPQNPEAPSNERPRSHIFLRVDQFHRENKEILLGRLRDLVEQRAIEGSRFLILAHETAPLEQTGPFSSFLAVCDVYRLADWTREDVSYMWRTWVPAQAESADQVAEACIEWTGGQPILANLYLGYLFERTDLLETKEIWDQAGSWLIEHPPQNALQHWQHELAKILDGSTLLRRKFSGFLAGETKRSVLRDELPLFLAGWIGQDEKGKWAIRSRAHARWGEGPFRAPERFYSRSGGV
ncbi:hypothetical protein AC249_AIPGENE9183, partial [Exaiptasia diaphana]